MFVDILVRVEVENGAFKVIDGFFELLLAQFHLIQKLCFLFFQFLVSLVDQFHEFFGATEDEPSLVEIFFVESVVEIL